jgi:tripartite-type tricarboxylate transporter receptor subunit TctC
VHAVKALARAALAAIALPRGSAEGIPTAPCAIVAFPAGGTLDVLAPAQKLSNW